MRFHPLRSPEDVLCLTEELGFLPFFANEIPGFSIEENCPRELWFSDQADGPWEWKGPTASSGRCVYGKFFGGRAGYVSREWFPDFANLRRDGYDFDARYDDGLAPRKDKDVFDVLYSRGPMLSKELKAACNYRKGGNRGFDTVITRLQMETYVVIKDFVYMRDKLGRPYGWGVAKYAAPEAMFGYEAVTAAYSRPPEESRRLLLDQLRRVLPEAGEDALSRLLR